MEIRICAACCILSAFSAVEGQTQPPAEVIPGDKAGDWVFRRISSGGLAGGRQEIRIVSGGQAELYQGFSPRPSCQLPISGPEDRKSTRLNSSHIQKSRMPSSA